MNLFYYKGWIKDPSVERIRVRKLYDWDALLQTTTYCILELIFQYINIKNRSIP